ncbi:hypothetical protein PRK78_005002 [Emydomyces testavorans]|uniref:Uncharacterized protein n=1 Tax=Emydomyces testavorans TaxID=2070801 RepID=A0AAF0DJU1_9EURO|nr:hypothetical protein PRK78_005002 [Emydomyces testavorans]
MSTTAAEIGVVRRKRGRPKKVVGDAGDEPQPSATTASVVTRKASKSTKSSKKAPTITATAAQKQSNINAGDSRALGISAKKENSSGSGSIGVKQTSSPNTAAPSKTSRKKEASTAARRLNYTNKPQEEKAKECAQLNSEPGVSKSQVSNPRPPKDAPEPAFLLDTKPRQKNATKDEQEKINKPQRPAPSPPQSPIEQSKILSAIHAANSPSPSAPPPSPPPSTPPTMPPPSTPPKTPASTLASSISQSRQILPHPTNTFKPTAKPQASPIVRNLDEITRIGAQRSMPAQPKHQPAVQDIRQTKQYKTFARSYALYERVFYDKQPRGLPGVNAFTQPESPDRSSGLTSSLPSSSEK